MREGQEMLLGGGSTRGWPWKIGMILIKGEGSFINSGNHMSKGKEAGKSEQCLGKSKSFSLVERRLFKFKE